MDGEKKAEMTSCVKLDVKQVLTERGRSNMGKREIGNPEVCVWLAILWSCHN